jgi:N-acetylmuramoyl-L-alanine amidase
MSSATESLTGLAIAPDPDVEPDVQPVSPAALRSQTGVILPISSDITGGWIVETPCANPAILVDADPIYPVQVLIDPGHGGDETGAVGNNGLFESEVNLDVAERLSEFLEGQGVSTLLTRSADYRMAIAVRGRLAQTVSPDVFVSIHHNGGPTAFIDEPGTLVFHQVDSPDSKRLGGLLYEELVDALDDLDIRFEAGSPPGAVAMLNDAGGDYYGVLRRTDGITAVLTEAMFLSNPDEARALEDPGLRQLEAQAIGIAIIRFLESDDPGSGFLEPRTFQGPGSGTGGVEGCVDPPLNEPPEE